MTESATPSFPELLRRAFDARLGDLHVALPGEVTAYNPTTQVADVRPMVKRLVPRRNGAPAASEDLPVLPAVPVMFPRGGGYFVSFPIAVGDTGLLVFCERDIQNWRRTGEATEPGDQRLHPLAASVFIPGLVPSAETLADADATNMVLGQDGGINIQITPSTMEVGGNADAAALASKVKSLETDFLAHFHNDPVSGTTGTPLVGAPPGAPSSRAYGSSKLKVED